MTEIELSKMKESRRDIETSGEPIPSKLPYPKAVFFIIATELSERFSYYGMRAVLTLYLRNMLHFSENQATTIYHTFLLLCYGLPVFWGIVADSYLGKFRTIWILSICFAVGNVILTLSSVPPLHFPAIPLSMIGLVLMAIGTGGMKPCVAPFGGEQFVLPQQKMQLQQFFSVFFFAVTVGNMISTVVTPIFRQDVHCFKMDSCYPLAFGVPACIMVLAVGIFACGKSLYKINKPEGNIMVKVVGCITYAFFKKKSDTENEKSHWLDRASDKYDTYLIRDVKGLLRVLLYYLPIPMFFALYEQLGSRWTLQANRMTGVVGSYTIKPDQMQVSNAILMFIFIPVFQGVIYPLFAKCNLLKKPLQRMCIGGFLAALSFLIAGIIEKQVEQSSYLPPTITETNINFINTFPCPVIIETEHSQTMIEGDSSIMVQFNNSALLKMTLNLNETCRFALPLKNLKWQGQIKLLPGELQSAVIHLNNDSIALSSFYRGEDVKKSNEGNAKIRIVLTDLALHQGSTYNDTRPSDVSVELTSVTQSHKLMINSTSIDDISHWAKEVSPNKYSFILNFLMRDQGGRNFDELEDGNLQTGGSYLLLIYPNYNKLKSFKSQLIILSPPNQVHMLWLIPQYVLMAWAEILFIISGMEFSFTEAPISMKSVLQSCWHLMNAFGNIIVILSAQGNQTHSQATQFFGFSGAMLIDTILFCLLAMRYKYVSLAPQEDNNANRPPPSFKIDEHV